MKRLRPFRQYWAALLTSYALLLFAAFGFHYLANRKQRRSLERRVDELSETIQSMQKKVRAVDGSSADGTERSEAVAGLPETSVGRPRYLGRGRCAAYVYCDYSYPDGYSARYYCRTNPTPYQLRQYLETLKADSREHCFARESNQRRDSGYGKGF